MNKENGVFRYAYSLTSVQIGLLVFLGAAFWFAAANAVRIGSSLGIFGQITSIVSFVVAIPISWLAVRLIIKVVDLKIEQIVPGISLGLAVATFCDGIAITWMSGLYGTEPAQIMLGAAWILWGIFTFTLGGYIEVYRREYHNN